MLIPLFIIGVAGSGFGGFIAHAFISDEIAEAIGWEAGGVRSSSRSDSPDLAIGFLGPSLPNGGMISRGHRDRCNGLRRGGHVRPYAGDPRYRQLGTGNTIQNVPHLLRPAHSLLPQTLSSRAGLPPGDGRSFDAWRASIVRASVVGGHHRLDSVRGRLCHGPKRTPSAFATLVAAVGFGLIDRDQSSSGFCCESAALGASRQRGRGTTSWSTRRARHSRDRAHPA